MQGSVWAVVWTTAVSITAVAALAAVTGGWIAGPATWLQRLLCLPAAVLLLYLHPVTIGIGLAFLAVAVAVEPDHPRPERSTCGGTMMIRRFRLVAAVVLVAGACGGRQQAAAPPESAGATSCEAGSGQITIATGNSTGVYYVLGGGLASLISANTPLKATAAETGASVQNIQQLVAGEYDVAFSPADTAADAVRGQGAFTAPQEVQALARIYSNYTHEVVQRSSASRR